MSRFGTSSTQRLCECEPDLQHIFRFVVERFDCSVLCGHRSEAAQNAVFESGKSRVQWPDSKHNSYPSKAIDVAPWPIDWRNLERFRQFGFYVKGVADAMHDRGDIEHRIRWGGDWDGDYDITDQHFNDLVHFELMK